MEPIEKIMERITENQKERESTESISVSNRLMEDSGDPQEAVRNSARRELWGRSSVPARHSENIPSQPGPWKDALESMKARIGSGFLCVAIGKRGTGKTQLGVNLIRQGCYQLRACLYVKALDIFIDLRETYKGEGGSERSVIQKYVTPPLLVIDALEERGETPFEDRLLNHIIDKRYDNCADTFLITNQSDIAFAESVGPSIISRIHETGDKIICDWESFRKKPA